MICWQWGSVYSTVALRVRLCRCTNLVLPVCLLSLCGVIEMLVGLPETLVVVGMLCGGRSDFEGCLVPVLANLDPSLCRRTVVRL